MFNEQKSFIKALFSNSSGFLLLRELKYVILGPKLIHSDTINPWSSKVISTKERKEAISLAVSWLLYAQQKMPDNGFGSFSIITGWSHSYPETTGYIIPTLLNYAKKCNNSKTKESAIKAADWLLAIQKKTGGWQGGYVDDDDPESVFNTGQILRGMIAAYRETNKQEYLVAIINGCDWLCSVQNSLGFWDKNTYLNMVRVYDSYVDAPLLMAYQITNEQKYKDAAINNLDWVLTKQRLNGWFDDCDNTIWGNSNPILHTLCYTIDGLLDSGIILNEQKYIEAAILASNELFNKFNKKKYLKGRLNENWNGTVQYIILTGYAQLAIIWFRLYKLTKNIQYLNSAMKLNDFLIFSQNRDNKELPNTKGALAGSFPIWGSYQSYTFPNWATKYFIDSLMLEQECLALVEEKQLHEISTHH